MAPVTDRVVPPAAEGPECLLCGSGVDVRSVVEGPYYTVGMALCLECRVETGCVGFGEADDGEADEDEDE